MTTTQLSTEAPRSTRRWLALSVLALAQFLVILDASIVNIALPSVGAELHLDTAALSWAITAYILPFGGLLLLGGKLADRFGHRRVFLIGVSGFIAASTLAGFATSGGMLFAARALQGTSAALLAPASLAIVTQLFLEPAARTRALGVWGAVAGIGGVAGVLLGGVLTATLGWRSVFFVNVPVGIVVLVVLPLLLTADPRGQRERLDIAGAVTVTLGLGSVVAALTQASALGFASPVTLTLAGVGALLLVAFALIERRAANPLVRFGIFRNRSVSAGNLAMFFAGGATTGLFFLLSVFMQQVLGYDALTAGLTQLPLAGTLVVVAALLPGLIARTGARVTLVAGLVIMAGGLLWLAAAPSDAGFVADLLGPSIVIGVGLAGAFLSGTQLAVSEATGQDAGLASGLVNTSQQMGGALGLAILATVAASHTATVAANGAALPVALGAGFSWAFLGAAAFALAGAAAVLAVARRPR
ncbi:MAG: transporter [Microbacteriaceae bacterium]|nr:transporter [Microbacteriaceae bacterium]